MSFRGNSQRAAGTGGSAAAAKLGGRLHVEWYFTAAFSLVGLWAYWRAPIHWESPVQTLYRDLASAFLAGFAIMIAWAYSEGLLDAVAQAERRGYAWLTRSVAVAVAFGLFALVPAPRASTINRILESAALGASLATAALALFLSVAGLVRLRQVAATSALCLRLWMPYAVYTVFSGYCLTATLLSTPLVRDPILLRMDSSLGFNPSLMIHAWASQMPWIQGASESAYALLGLMISGVIARIQVAGAWTHARRAVLAVCLVGLLGLGCYQLIPAIGPIFAFPALYHLPGTAAAQAEVHTALQSALAGASQMPGPARILRNVMPSLHTAFTLVALTAAWNWRRAFFWQCLPLGLLQVATTLVLGYHYFVDLLAAVPLSVFCWWAADAAIRTTPDKAEQPLLAEVRPRPAKTNVRFGISLAASFVGLIGWGAFAPLSPTIAWPIAAIIVAGPVWAAACRERGR